MAEDSEVFMSIVLASSRVSHRGQARGSGEISSERCSVGRRNDKNVKGESELGYLYIHILLNERHPF